MIRFGLPKESVVSLTVYNTLGEKVAELINGEALSEGIYSYNFNASILPSGIYVYRLTAGEFAQTKKMLITK